MQNAVVRSQVRFTETNQASSTVYHKIVDFMQSYTLQSIIDYYVCHERQGYLFRQRVSQPVLCNDLSA